MYPQQQKRNKRLGQTTVGPNRDMRLDERQDGMYEILEVVFSQTDVPTKPQYNSRMIVSLDGMRRLSDLIAGVIDALERRPEAMMLPINDSDYMKRRDDD